LIDALQTRDQKLHYDKSIAALNKMAFRPMPTSTALMKDPLRIASKLGSHIFVTFKDRSDRTLFRVDSNPKNVPDLLEHTVFISISKSTAAITIREMLGKCGVPPNILGALTLARNQFAVVRVGTEYDGSTGNEALCILLSLQPNTLHFNSIILTLPQQGRHIPRRLDFQGINQPLSWVRSIKIHFAMPWGNNDLKTEQIELIKLILQPRAPGLRPPPRSYQPASARTIPAASMSPQPSASATSHRSNESSRGEPAIIQSIEEGVRVRELVEQLCKQKEENEKEKKENNKRMQDIENMIRGQNQIHSRVQRGVGGAEVAEAVQLASPSPPMQDPRPAAQARSRDVAAHEARVKEPEETVDEKDQRVQDLEAEVRTQAELISTLEDGKKDQRIRKLEAELQTKTELIATFDDAGKDHHIQELEAELQAKAELIVTLEDEYSLKDGPDLAALGAELAFARGIDKGDRAGVVIRLPSSRLAGEVVGRLVQNLWFRKAFLELSHKRRARSQEREVVEVGEEAGDEHVDKKLKIEEIEAVSDVELLE
jgi:hypothetical protein